MIKLEFHAPLHDPDWSEWRKKAERATRTVKRRVTTGQRCAINEKLYKAQRLVFLQATHSKCAYCEVDLPTGQLYGDVEHYRPKLRVTDARGRVIMIPGANGQPPRPHPGYPWLAYDPSNLLPACLACNRPGTLRTGERIGKWDQFPVRRFRASKPGDETMERPLLLHPVFDEPEKHLTLQLETGMLCAKTARGEATITILGLNREGLPEARRDVATDVQALVVAARTSLDEGLLDDARSYIQRIASYRSGTAPFSWAGRLTLDALGAETGGAASIVTTAAPLAATARPRSHTAHTPRPPARTRRLRLPHPPCVLRCSNSL